MMKQPDVSDATGVYFEAKPFGKDLIIAFGGNDFTFEVPFFEFFSITNSLDKSRLMFRDITRNWYHDGVAGAGKDIDDIALYIDAVIDKHEFENVTAVGCSAGAYAAILFGMLCNIDNVHAFSPQTAIGRVEHIPKEHRWNQRGIPPEAYDKRYCDLKNVEDASESPAALNIHFGTQNERDVFHAERISDNPNVRLHTYDSHHHVVVKDLKESGELATILEQ